MNTACTLCGSSSHNRSACPMGRTLNTMRSNYRQSGKHREEKAIASAILTLARVTKEGDGFAAREGK